MSDETPGNAGASTSTVPPGNSAAETNSGVTETPASSPGSTASPSPISSPEPSSTSSEAASGEAFDFGAMFGEAPPEIPAQKEPPVPQAKEPPKVEPPVAAPPSQQQATPEPTPQPAAPPVQAQQPQAPSLDTFDPEALSRHLADNEGAAVQFTAENLFKMSPEEIEALETNVVEAVPRLLAKVLVKSQQSMLSQMARIVPAMIQRQTEILRRNADNESKFYSRWPDIKADKHGDLVRKYAAVYRQMHPQTTLEQMVEDLGPMVMMAARVVPQVAGSPGAVAPSPVSRPAPANGRSPPPPPFVPAGAGATNSQRAPELNPIEVMFQDHS